jgi:hypothetical protein
MLRMQTGKQVGFRVAMTMPPLGRLCACSGSQPILVRNEAADADSAGLRPGCGRFPSVAAAFWQPVETVSLSRLRLIAPAPDGMDCTRLRTVRGHG